ncbi:MAG: dUTP diphosphatase [Bacteroidia bacterium]|nr:dUTP diphosphatase [Bacteroidia bacterium]MCZ2277622.1 dUTP diphosphatase [Bacteroidia bacterium]
MKIRIVNQSKHPLPAYETIHAAGMDLKAELNEPITLPPGVWKLVPTGLFIEIPAGYEGQVRPRSGLAFKHGVTVLNAPGTIDADYRGELKVLLINHSAQPYTIEDGERIAQLVVASYEQVEWTEVEKLVETERGRGGFGSTGK